MRRRKPKRLLPKLLACALLLVGLYTFVFAGGEEPLQADATPHTAGGPFHLRANTSPPATPEDFPLFIVAVPVMDIIDTQYLKLVNRDRAITRPVQDARLVTVWPDMPARAADVMLHETAFIATRDLFRAAERAHIRGLFIASGFRDQAEQSELYANAIDRRYTMPPGHSEHQLGLAADILVSDLPSMVGSLEAQWLADNAPAFGLILRYPADKEDITGVAYEPWHFRYVGQVHAWYMTERNFVLEEYVAYLGEQGGFRAEFAGRHYYVLYQRPQNGMLLVPDGLDFWVSSANTGGYIVTAWR
ncbi:MAG: M15 family metallopeptidase [Oscillospiraceae bacterium]|nr:M15 family metallopeptidase [Oscillospiraceae bacterium]